MKEPVVRSRSSRRRRRWEGKGRRVRLNRLNKLTQSKLSNFLLNLKSSEFKAN